MEEEEHEVYGGEIPVEAEMDGDMNADVDMSAADGDAVKELDEMKKRLKEMEEEATALREMQAKVEKEMGAVQDPAAATSQANKEEVDSRSIFVGNLHETDLKTLITLHIWYQDYRLRRYSDSEASKQAATAGRLVYLSALPVTILMSIWLCNYGFLFYPILMKLVTMKSFLVSVP